MALQFGKVIGQFVALIADTTNDVDETPDQVPLSGTVIFTAAAKAVLVAGATPNPQTVLPLPVTATLDANGYLSLNGLKEVYLLSTSDTSENPSGWTWQVALTLDYNGSPVRYGPFNINVPTFTGSNAVDLTLAAPVPSNAGTAIVQGPAGPAGPQGPAGPAGTGGAINDSAIATTSTWSSSKTKAYVDANGGGSDSGTIPTGNIVVYRLQNSDGSWPVRDAAGTLPDTTLVIWLGLTLPPNTTGYAVTGDSAQVLAVLP